MTDKPERGATLWGWAIRVMGAGVFIHQAIIRHSNVNFGIAFLAMCAAALPLREFGGVLRSWMNRKDPG